MSHHCPLESRPSNEKSNVDSFFVLGLFFLYKEGLFFILDQFRVSLYAWCAEMCPPFVLVWVKAFYSDQSFCLQLSLYRFMICFWEIFGSAFHVTHQARPVMTLSLSPPHPGAVLTFLLTLVHFWYLANTFPCPSLTWLYLVGKLKPSLNSITNTLCPSTQTAEHC